MASSVVALVSSLSPRAWAEIAGAAFVACLTWAALGVAGAGDSSRPVPTIEAAQRVELGEMRRSQWQRLLVHEAPQSVDTTCSVLPSSFLADTSGQNENALPNVEYRSRGGGSPSVQLPQVPYVVVPVTEGRPSVDVGRETVRLRGADPTTGGALTYEYDVPRPRWGLNARGQAWAGRQSLAGATTLGAWHRIRDWRIRLGVGVGASVVSGGAAAGPVGTIGLTRPIAQW